MVTSPREAEKLLTVCAQETPFLHLLLQVCTLWMPVRVENSVSYTVNFMKGGSAISLSTILELARKWGSMEPMEPYLDPPLIHANVIAIHCKKRWVTLTSYGYLSCT